MNWRNDYPEKGCEDFNRWAWEFLRRNDDYQKDWTVINELVEQGCERAHFDVGPCDRCNRLESYGRYFGLRVNEGVPDPASSNPTLYVLGNTVAWHRYMPYGSYSDAIFPKHGGQVLVKFDVSRPLVQQINDAKQELEIMQKELGSAPDYKVLPKRDTRSWGKYLRILDAIQRKASPDEMIREFVLDNNDEIIIPQDRSAFSKLKKKANYLCKHGHTQILAFDKHG